jgi:hypothetical protein
VDTSSSFRESIHLDALGLPTREPFGRPGKVRQSLFTDPIRTQGIRDYHPRDRFRDVHWKASARAGACRRRSTIPPPG